MLTKIPSKILKNTRGNFILSNIAFLHLTTSRLKPLSSSIFFLLNYDTYHQASRLQCEHAASLEDFAANRSQWEHFLQIADIEAQSNSKRQTTADQTPPEKTRVWLWKLRKKDLVHQLRYRLRCFHRLNTTQQSNLLLSLQCLQYRLSLRKGFRRISNCQHSTKSTNWYWSTQLPLYIADILEPQAKNENKVGDFKPTNSIMDRYLRK